MNLSPPEKNTWHFAAFFLGDGPYFCVHHIVTNVLTINTRHEIRITYNYLHAISGCKM
jgi:hypothetical protein